MKQTNQKTTWPTRQYIVSYALLNILFALPTPRRGVIKHSVAGVAGVASGPAQAFKEARAQHRRAKKLCATARPVILPFARPGME